MGTFGGCAGGGGEKIGLAQVVCGVCCLFFMGGRSTICVVVSCLGEEKKERGDWEEGQSEAAVVVPRKRGAECGAWRHNQGGGVLK